MVCSIEESNDVTTLSIDELQRSLLVHGQRMKINQEKEEDQVLKIANYDDRGGSSNRGREHGGFRVRGRGRLGKDQIKCYKCHKIWHYQSECATWRENDANFAEFDESEELLLTAQQEVTKSNNQVWFLDSGCSNNMVGTKEWLFNFDERFREYVKL